MCTFKLLYSAFTFIIVISLVPKAQGAGDSWGILHTIISFFDDSPDSEKPESEVEGSLGDGWAFDNSSVSVLGVVTGLDDGSLCCAWCKQVYGAKADVFEFNSMLQSCNCYTPTQGVKPKTIAEQVGITSGICELVDGTCYSHQHARGNPPSHILTPSTCKWSCGRAGYTYAGMQRGIYCFCTNDKPTPAMMADPKECKSKCRGDREKICGGTRAMNLYKTGPLDCQWSEFSDWDECSVTCGKGVQRQTRSVILEERNGGAKCEGSSEVVRNCWGPPC